MINSKKLISAIAMSTVLSSHLLAAHITCTPNADNEYLVTNNNGDWSDNSLRSCVRRAYGSGQNSTVLFDGNMTITLEGHIRIDTPNNTTIDAGTNNIIIDGDGAVGIINAESNSGVITLKNLTLQNANTGGSNGGAIYLNGSLVVDNCTIKDNNASNGAGIYADNTDTITIKNNSIFSGNGASVSGGGLYSNSNEIITIENSTFSKNVATSGEGGAIRAKATLTINNSTFTGNTANLAGGIFADASTVDINNSTVSGNNALNIGGLGIENGNMTIQHSTISGNTATSHVGGLYARRSNVNIKNSTISTNTAGNNGGGIYVDACPIFSIESSTITNNNTARTGGGIFNKNNSTTITIENTILAGNTAPTSPDADTVWSLDYNLVGNITTFIGYNPNTDKNNTDPVLAVLADNGGDTLTHALKAGSPAINAGNTALTTDQRGLPRTGLADIGAYEAQSSGVVNAPAFIDDYVDNSAKAAANELPVASTPLSSSAKGLMALLFAGVAFFGFRRKEKLV